MTGELAWNDVDGVDADRVAAFAVADGELLSGMGHSPEAVVIEGEGGGFGSGAGLDLDESEGAAAPGDEIDFAAAGAGASGENPPTVESEPPGGESLRAAAALLGQCSAQRLRSSARA